MQNKINHIRHKSIKKRLLDFYSENNKKIKSPLKEIDWGKPVGKELNVRGQEPVFIYIEL